MTDEVRAPAGRHGWRRLAVGAGGLALAAGAGAGGFLAVSGTATAAKTASSTAGPSAASSRLHWAAPAVVGTVASVGTSSFTVTTAANKVFTVNVSSSTTFRDPAVSAPGLSKLTKGEHVAVVGTTSGSTVTATTVLVGTFEDHRGVAPFGGPGFLRPAVVGTVASVGTSSFTVTTAANKVFTVNVSSSTTFRDPAVSAPGLSKLTKGEHVAVVGTTSGSTVTATTVLVGTFEDHRGVAPFGGPGKFGPSGGPGGFGRFAPLPGNAGGGTPAA